MWLQVRLDLGPISVLGLCSVDSMFFSFCMRGHGLMSLKFKVPVGSGDFREHIIVPFMPHSPASTTPGHLGCYHCPPPISMVTEVLLQVSEKLKLAEKTALDIDRLRDGYRPAARRGAILFFVLSEMALVNSMYQYSLIAFLEVFGLSLKKSLPDSILLKRLKNIMDTLTFNIYNYGCTGEGREPGSDHRNLAGPVPAAH